MYINCCINFCFFILFLTYIITQHLSNMQIALKGIRQNLFLSVAGNCILRKTNCMTLPHKDIGQFIDNWIICICVLSIYLFVFYSFTYLFITRVNANHLGHIFLRSTQNQNRNGCMIKVVSCALNSSIWVVHQITSII